MPEGHVIHHQARRIRRAFRGHALHVDSPQGRFAQGAELVDGRVLTKAEAHGKHLFLGFEGNLWIHVHLGLFGKWQFREGPPVPIVGEVRLRLIGNDHVAELRGATTCEVLDAKGKRAKVLEIGPDPIRRDADPERAWLKVHRSVRTIGELLMDQSIFAGVGNIYRAEVLFRHGVSPYLPGRDVTREQFDAMWADLVILMRQGATSARIDTVRSEHSPRSMKRRSRKDRHGGEVYVYRRAGDPCLVCTTPVATTEMQSRNLFWCPACQSM